MKCAKPYVKLPTGVKRLHTLLSQEARQAVTPFPCGKCLPCRINRARIWSHRIMLENTVSDGSCFVTLTYNDEHLPKDGNLKPNDLTKFLKRLRSHYPPKTVRYFACGEYGTESLRPHYHAMLFNVPYVDFKIIEKAWCDPRSDHAIGHIKVGDVTPHSARYITGYVVKNETRVGDPRLNGRSPEFSRMSRKPGIGAVAADRIADSLKDNKWFKPRMVREVMYAKNQVEPNGRYISNRIAQRCDLPECVADLELYEWQEEIFENAYGKGDDGYYENLVDTYAQARLKMEKKYKIWKQKRKL